MCGPPPTDPVRLHPHAWTSWAISRASSSPSRPREHCISHTKAFSPDRAIEGIHYPACTAC
uniref:Uncharacterized protein n=1 Tax=Anguilla anguilla TaxID=7936 RepID=A0A0E9UZH1_ANGAN